MTEENDLDRTPYETSAERDRRSAESAQPPESRSRLVAAIVGAALLSAGLSAAVTYGAIELTVPAAAPSQPSATIASATAVPGALTSLHVADVVAIAAEASPSVVTITTTGFGDLSPFSVPTSGAGSGIVVTAAGLILTNDHVVAGSSSLQVALSDGRTFPASVVATDPTHDIAVIRIAAPGLTPARLGESANLTVGQLAVAIGSPLGTFTDTVTEGIVSGIDRTIETRNPETGALQRLEGLIQTDAAINPGNSGGPLLDSAGTVVGIITAQASGAQGVGFAIPIDAARDLVRSASGG